MSFHHVASVDFCDLSVGSHTMSTALYRIHPSTIMNMPYLSGRSVMLHPLPYTSDEISLAAYAVYALEAVVSTVCRCQYMYLKIRI
jgi:hypothetical protein